MICNCNDKCNVCPFFFRCGRLVYHLGLPYSFLTFPYVEEAIKIAYCEKKCGNCSLMVFYFSQLFLLGEKRKSFKSSLNKLIFHDQLAKQCFCWYTKNKQQ